MTRCPSILLSLAAIALFGEVAVAWLDYQLKGSAEAGKYFVGADCRLCTEPVWTIAKKGMR